MYNLGVIKHSKKYSDGIIAIPVLLILSILSLFWFFSSSVLIYVGSLFALLSALTLLFLYKIKYKELYKLITLITLLLFFKIISQHVTSNLSDSGHYITLISGIIIGYLANKYDKKYIIIKVFYYFMFLYAIIVLLMLGLGISADNIWLGSRNLSGLLFVTYGSLFLLYQPATNYLKLKKTFYFIVFIICVLSIGRSGIITSFILLIAAILETYSLKLTKNQVFKFLVGIIALIFIGLCFKYFLSFFNALSQFEYLRSAGVEDNYRSLMIEEFFNNYSIKTFLFGMDLSSLPYISSFENNPHNGYIYLNATFGIVAIIMYAYILGFFTVLFKRRDIVRVLAMIAILVRFGTDSPPSLILFAFVFLSMYCFFQLQSNKGQ